jgi:hypothetical protein
MIVVKVLVGVIAAIIFLVGIGWLGTQVNARSFTPPKQNSAAYGSIHPPQGLPEPVARYVQAAFGNSIPLIKSAVIIGRAEMRINGLTLPARFKFYHDAGNAYYHLIQVTWFGIPILTVNERYLDGEGMLDLPGGLIQNEPKVNAAANQGLWAEGIWLPSVWFTDERVRWEAVDANTARLIIPNATEEEQLTVHFDPTTGLIAEVVSLRYQDKADENRQPWTSRTWGWQSLNGVQVPLEASIRWGDDEPWVVWHVEQVIYNIDVTGRLAQFGGDFAD